jgi:hypothetical protein
MRLRAGRRQDDVRRHRKRLDGLAGRKRLIQRSEGCGPHKAVHGDPCGQLEGPHGVARGWAHNPVELELGARSQPVEAVLKPDAVADGLVGGWTGLAGPEAPGRRT